jgi:hypothetical protein
MEERIREIEKEIRMVDKKLNTVISMLWQLIPIDKRLYDDISKRLDKPLRKYKKRDKITDIENKEEVNHGNQRVITQ